MASDYLLEIEGIKGESQDHKHKGTIDVSSFSWGASQPGGFHSGGGGGAGKVSYSDISFTKGADKASPVLMEFCATGDHLKKAVLYVRKAGKEAQEYYQVTLQDILISSFSNGGHSGGDSSVSETFSLNFAKIQFEYKEQDATGKLLGSSKGGYDLKAGKKM